MDASSYWKYQMLATGTMGILLGLGFYQGNRLLVGAALVAGIVSVAYIRRQVDEPLYDERSATVSTKASAAAFSAVTLLSLAASAVLFFLGNMSSPEYLPWAYGLAFLVCGSMIVRLFFWLLYTRRFGG